MAKEILNIQHLKRSFAMGGETVHALKDVSFSVQAGEFVTIMGSSGSGKTTMLNILGCLDKPSDGTYLLDGADVKTLSRDELARLRNHKIGFVFQAYNLLPRTSAIENVELPPSIVSVGLERMRHQPLAIEAKIRMRTHHEL